MNLAVTQEAWRRARTSASPLAARPFLKWAGGKSRLLSTFNQFFPESFNNYFEPFVGSGAVFFHLRPDQAHLSDSSSDLINCYQVVRDNVNALIKVLKKHKYGEDHFYSVRALDPQKLSEVERAARMIYLNKTCFNGLYRVNSQGKFNVPFGRYKNPLICDEANLRLVGASLKEVKIECQKFESVLAHAKKRDFIYFDPPYQPLSSTSNFTNYTKDSFSFQDQERLHAVIEALTRRGCYVMLSNSNAPSIRKLYADYRIEKVQALRAINCKSDRRKAITELVVLNY